MPTVVFADEQDDIASIRTKLEGVVEGDVAVVVPRGNHALVSPIALRLLRRQAEAMALDVSLVTADASLRRAAREEGLRVFGSPRAYQRTHDRTPAPFDHTREVLGQLLARTSSLLMTALALGIALLAVGLVYILVPVATVTVAPRSEVVSGTVSVVADPSLRALDPTGARVPARVVYLLVEAVDQMPTGEGRAAEPGRATGVVTFTNRSAQETIIPTGTIVSTPGGVRFRTSEELRLAPGLGHTGRVSVVAVDPGTGGNVARLQITRIEGLLQGYALVTNEEQTAGGGAQTTPVVTSDDQQRLQTRVMERARQEALTKLSTMPADREMLLTESVEFTPLDVTFDHEVGQPTQTLSIRLKARAAGTFVSQRDVEEVARRTWQPTPRPGYQVAPDGIKMDPPTVTKVEGRTITLAANLKATTLAQANPARIEQYARWRTGPEAEREIARGFDLAQPPVVRIDPVWAERAYRVRVVVDADPS